jgi:hypothetical protein
MNQSLIEEKKRFTLGQNSSVLFHFVLLFMTLLLTLSLTDIGLTQPDTDRSVGNGNASLNKQQGETDSYLYLPVVLWVVPTEEEPNDTLDDANCIEPGPIYWGRFPDSTDETDYYCFDLTSSALVRISLTSIAAGHDYTLILRDSNGEFMAQSANPDNVNELLELPNASSPIPLEPGRYYIQVFNASGTGSSNYYNLQLTINEILMIASFDGCGPPNDLGGDMGAACPVSGCPPPDQLFESYLLEPPRDCVGCMEYHIQNWSAFWTKLKNLDMTPYNYLVFDIRGTGDIVGRQLKVEIKRDCHTEPGGTVCYELEIKYVGGITPDWQHKRIPLSEFILYILAGRLPLAP